LSDFCGGHIMVGGRVFFTVSGICERQRGDARGTIAAATRPHVAVINQVPTAICRAADERAVQQWRRFFLASPIPNAPRSGSGWMYRTKARRRGPLSGLVGD